MTRNAHLEALQKKLKKIATAGDLESLAHDRFAAPATEDVLESATEPHAVGETLESRLTTGLPLRSAEVEAAVLRKLANGDFDDVSPREQVQLEAIVEVEGRPASFIEGGRFLDLPDPWTHFNDTTGTIRQRIQDAILRREPYFTGRFSFPLRGSVAGVWH